MTQKSSTVDSWSALLRENGHRSTVSLHAVIRVFDSSRKAISPEEIHAAARRHCPSLGLATVYRILGRMEQLGTDPPDPSDQGLQLISPRNGPARALAVMYFLPESGIFPRR